MRAVRVPRSLNDLRSHVLEIPSGRLRQGELRPPHALVFVSTCKGARWAHVSSHRASTLTRRESTFLIAQTAHGLRAEIASTVGEPRLRKNVRAALPRVRQSEP